jgi:F420H(2)-dependent quinone reductase
MASQQQTTQQPRPSGMTIAFRRLFMQAHIFFYRLTGGILGGNLGGRHMLLLTTRGRKSGQERVTPIFYIPDGERFILIASNWGAHQHPQWWLNLLAHPHATVQTGRNITPVTARQADPQEYQHLWSRITSKYHEFENYQKGTTREIPVVILTPQH